MKKIYISFFVIVGLLNAGIPLPQAHQLLVKKQDSLSLFTHNGGSVLPLTKIDGKYYVTVCQYKRFVADTGSFTYFKDAKAWKAANLSRYKEILNARVGTRDQVDSMVAKIVQLSNNIVAESMGLPKLGRYNQIMATVNGNEVELENVTKGMSKALYYYGEYIQLQNEAEKQGDDQYSKKYSEDRMKQKAGNIKMILNKFKSGKLDGWY